MPITASKRRVLTLGATGLMAVGLAVGTWSTAFAEDSGSGSSPGRPELTAAQKSCLEGQGVTRPTDGTRPTEEQRAKMMAAAEACGLPARPAGGGGGPGHQRMALTDAQKSCLEGQGVTRPERGTPPSAEQRAKHEAAAAACGIQLPVKPSTSA